LRIITEIIVRILQLSRRVKFDVMYRLVIVVVVVRNIEVICVVWAVHPMRSIAHMIDAISALVRSTTAVTKLMATLAAYVQSVSDPLSLSHETPSQRRKLVSDNRGLILELFTTERQNVLRHCRPKVHYTLLTEEVRATPNAR
jgi:hypothetical protein